MNLLSCRSFLLRRLRLAWERLGVPREELDKVAGEREVWASLLRLLPPRPDQDKRKKMDGWMDGRTIEEEKQLNKVVHTLSEIFKATLQKRGIKILGGV